MTLKNPRSLRELPPLERGREPPNPRSLRELPPLERGRIISTAYIALGSNLNNPREQVNKAIQALDAHVAITVVKQSSLHETAPWGYADQPNFINAVVAVQTTLEPLALLDACLAIESAFGRVRTMVNGPRIIDLDLIMYENVELVSERLTLPHPRMHERAFVMEPLKEVLDNAH